MGYARYELYRNGEKIEAGYAVNAVCDKDGCITKIDRGLAYLCGQTPGGDEYGCGGYYCADHLTWNQQCEPCGEKADEENTWTDPTTGAEYDLRNEYLPPGEAYKPDGWVWKHLGTFQDGVPVVVPVQLPDHRPGGHSGVAITTYAFRVAGSVAWGQELSAKAGESRG